MSLGHALNNAYSGLTVSSRRAEVTANNIANASTPGYIKRTLELESATLGGRGAGVNATGVELASRPDLTASRRLADASATGAVEVSEASRTLARLIGEPEDPGALTERFSNFESSLRRLSDDPSATYLQTDVVNTAQDLVDGLDDIQNSVNDLRSQADREIGLAVDDVNRTLNEIYELNASIRKEVGVGGDVSPLIAEREGLINDLSDVLPVKTYPTAHDGMTFTTASGFTLVSEGKVFELEFTPSPVVTADMDLIGGAPGPLSGLTLHNQDITPPGSDIVPTGKLAGLFQVRDVDAVAFQGQIDAIAKDVIDRFEEVDAAGLGLFVDPADTRAADLSELQLNLPSSATGAAGNVYSTGVDYFDAAGAKQTLTVEFTSTGVADEWTMTVADSAIDPLLNPISENTLTFDAAGDLATVVNVSGPVHGATTAGAFTLPVAGGAQTVTLEIGDTGAPGFLSQRNEDFGPANYVAATPGLAGRIAINPAVDPTQGGDASLLRDGFGGATNVESGQNAHAVSLLEAFTGTRDAPAGSGLAGSFSAFDLVAGVSSAVSTKMLSDEETATLRTTRLTTLVTAEASALGVDLDYELQELNNIQTAYAANARVLEVIDQMLQSLLEI